MSLATLCTPRPSVFNIDRRAQVLSLDTFLNNRINGREFFEENHITQGMDLLIDRTLRHLHTRSGGSTVFTLSQSMGGGKTHSMIALGLLAQDPQLRQSVLGAKNPAPNLGAVRTIGFNGRNTDAPGGILGELGRQLGKQELVAPYISGVMSAPGPEAWANLLRGEPLIIFLDELPPYLEYATSVPVGNSSLAVFTQTTLANLFVAVTELSNVCVVLSDLAGSNYTTGQEGLSTAFESAKSAITNEAARIATPITPVSAGGDELFAILTKRLFSKTAGESDISRVGVAYRDAMQDATRMNLTSSDPMALQTKIESSYPFHPDLRDLFGRFKENPGFQQTRGIIRLMQMIVANLWNTNKAERLDLIHPYDFDLANEEIRSEFNSINPSLQEAMAHDICRDNHAEAETIDAENKSVDATETARLLLFASLSTTQGAVAGLREFQIIDALVKPKRDLSSFRTDVLDKLNTRAWYLHTSPDGRIFFKNQQNLAARLNATAQNLNVQLVEQKLRKTLEEYVLPSMKDCYQITQVLPAPDAVSLDSDKTTLIVVRPFAGSGAVNLSADWQDWWSQQNFKNRVVFLTGNRDNWQRTMEAARNQRALEQIEDDLRSEGLGADDPQWANLGSMRDRVAIQYHTALKESFDVIVYPSINNQLRSEGVSLAFAGNSDGEKVIRETLINVRKMVTEYRVDQLKQRAEDRLWGTSDSVLWSEIKRSAAINTNWPIMRTDTLDRLRADCVRDDVWRNEGDYVRKGPFPLPPPDVSIRELSKDTETGVSHLRINVLNADRVVFETGDNDPTIASAIVESPELFIPRGLRYRFLAYRSDDVNMTSVVREWTADLEVRYQIHNRGSHREVELTAFPANTNLRIKFTTDGTSPTSTVARNYDGPFQLPAECRVVQAIAIADQYQMNSSTLTIRIDPDKGDGLQPDAKGKWTKQITCQSASSVFAMCTKLSAYPELRLATVNVAVESGASNESLDYSLSNETGLTIVDLDTKIRKLQDIVSDANVTMRITSLIFNRGDQLLDFLKESNEAFDMKYVKLSGE